jgi:hypothetical protein
MCIVQPAIISLTLALVFEVPLAIFFSLFGARPFAPYVSGSDDVAGVTEYMWRSIDWCYIFYAVSTQMATALLATRPPGISIRAWRVICFMSCHRRRCGP